MITVCDLGGVGALQVLCLDLIVLCAVPIILMKGTTIVLVLGHQLKRLGIIQMQLIRYLHQDFIAQLLKRNSILKVFSFFSFLFCMICLSSSILDTCLRVLVPLMIAYNCVFLSSILRASSNVVRHFMMNFLVRPLCLTPLVKEIVRSQNFEIYTPIYMAFACNKF